MARTGYVSGSKQITFRCAAVILLPLGLYPLSLAAFVSYFRGCCEDVISQKRVHFVVTWAQRAGKATFGPSGAMKQSVSVLALVLPLEGLGFSAISRKSK